ncbi:hypothetical protein FSP39_024451 [Pinctada imbricata]|uniref:Uncharacterized protein n=1 Tax=Pinctada imbricata TaxID=66713 RepID=A0AA88XK52_PINIB|nr:hypothetical protein FSP39_024451 [Pinctada imbricata]
MAIIILFRTLLFTCITISYVGECGSLSDAQSLYAYITGSVNKYLRPESNQSEPTELVLSFHLKSISGLDEVHGVLYSALSINVAWIDDSISWNPNSYGGISEIKLHSSLIWVPDLILGNPANRISRIGLADVPVTIKSTGHVIHIIPDLLESTCDVDVTYFPFDSQKCVIEIIVVGYMSDIKFKVGGKIDTTHYSENNLWILASAKSGISDMGGLPFVRLSLSLKRRYSFFILNLFSPVLIMIMLNIMVFMLPPDSGERVGYAITCLLALSVYMTFASENLPVSSKPIPIVTYVLLVYNVKGFQLSTFLKKIPNQFTCTRHVFRILNSHQ